MIACEFEIEKMEKDVLLEISFLFKNSLNTFSTSIDKSLKYLKEIIVPLIIASKEGKSHNPFFEIIEKYVIHILTYKLINNGYEFLPLGYSADLSMRSDKNYILNIDIKTANIDNPSDFKETINIGLYQMTHIANLRIGNKTLSSPFFVYPGLPPYYEHSDGSKELILTYGLLFIYPSYKDVIDEIREEYNTLFKDFKEKICRNLSDLKLDLCSNLNNEKAQLITESIIRGVFVHKQKKDEIINKLNLDNKCIENFSQRIEKIAIKLYEKDIKPIAIVAISIPNGLLKDKYINRFVSGKNYSKSARYHYEDGIFEIIKEKTGEEIPRIVFLDLNEAFKNELKQYFNKIRIFDYSIKEL